LQASAAPSRATTPNIGAGGGTAAHLGYFREAFVVHRAWIDDRADADLVALFQFVPGPASSQAGIGIGLAKAGLPGAFAAWFAFTMPSALALLAFGYGVLAFEGAIASGVDSSVVAALLNRAVGDWLTCIFVDTGLLRLDEGARDHPAILRRKLLQPPPAAAISFPAVLHHRAVHRARGIADCAVAYRPKTPESS
jgi:hypothetical protein